MDLFSGISTFCETGMGVHAVKLHRITADRYCFRFKVMSIYLSSDIRFMIGRYKSHDDLDIC